MKNRQILTPGRLLFLLIALCLLILNYHALKVRISYRRAEKLIWEEQYTKAREILDSIEDDDYHDTEALIYLCFAHEAYDDGNYTLAHAMMAGQRFYYQTQERMDAINEFQESIDSHYATLRRSFVTPTPKPATPTPAPTPAWRPSVPKSSTKKEEPKEDPFNASDYYDPEDFYEDNYDDFWDYEDAEDYWKEHH